jgi:hypothetical protein
MLVIWETEMRTSSIALMLTIKGAGLPYGNPLLGSRLQF